MEAKKPEMESGEKPQELSALPVDWVLTSLGEIGKITEEWQEVHNMILP